MDNLRNNQPTSGSNESSEIRLLRMDNQPTSSSNECSENPPPRMDNSSNNQRTSSSNESSKNIYPRMDNPSNNPPTSSSNESSKNIDPTMDNPSNNQPTSSSNESSKNIYPTMDNPSNNPQTSSFEKNREEFNSSVQESKYEEAIKNETNMCNNDTIVKSALEAQQEIKVVDELIVHLTLIENLYQLLKQKNQNSPNTVKDGKPTYPFKACEEVAHLSDFASTDSGGQPVAFNTSLSTNFRTLSDLINYLSQCDQSSDDFWNIDTERLKARLGTLTTKMKEKSETLLEIAKRTDHFIDEIDALTQLVEYIERDRCVIYSRRRDEAILVNKTLKSVNRLLCTYFKTLVVKTERLTAHVKSFLELEQKSSLYISAFLYSDLYFYT